MRILGLDIGAARIGAAVSDPGLSTALPLEVIDARDKAAAIDRICELISEYEADSVVYGLPLSMSGDSGPQSAVTETFADELRKKAGVPLIARDERLTSQEAERTLIAQGVKREKRKLIIDKLAAAIILQSYLDGEHGKKQG
jgi:putative holliday junction resolvase